ncbi:hypothetical protein LTR27_007073 [Elasticomyces elasticus]|nr:hypothetical protein LTR27_007073 [Elasticomyces elasticus]
MTDLNQHQPGQLIWPQALARPGHDPALDKRSHGCNFMDLPGEVRNQIYKLYARSAAVNIEDYQQKWFNNALARVSQGIATEYRDWYFSSRSFMIDVRSCSGGFSRRLETWRAWLAGLRECDARGLSRILIYGDYGPERVDIVSRKPATVVISKKGKDGWYKRDDNTQMMVTDITESCKSGLGKEEILRIVEVVLEDFPVKHPRHPEYPAQVRMWTQPFGWHP